VILKGVAEALCVLRGYVLTHFAPQDEAGLSSAILNILHPEVRSASARSLEGRKTLVQGMAPTRAGGF
jgi:hypothetical protein